MALSLLLQLNREAMDLAVVELVPRDDGRFEERPAPSAAYLDVEAWLVKKRGG